LRVAIGQAVEHVPRTPDIVGAGYMDQTRPAWVETGEPAWGQSGSRRSGGPCYQRISITPAFRPVRPDPIPIQRTRSPGESVSATDASVIGIAAGPMLP